MKIHNNEWSTRTINNRLSLLYVAAYPATLRLVDEDFINGSYGFLKDLRSHQPRFVLLNLRGFQFTISPEVQDWLVENIFPFMETLKIEKVAIVTSLDALSHLSVEQTIEEDLPTSKITRYFQGETNARRWLLEEETVTV
ncbi:hypothetical protein [Microscilla marina]|uniref:STAS/SEC14 domain-containing protein n=1 Tax=Microscilla marina ATCC 23134 TaxID=313606 RepID=A1ZXY3_MICM2|nr:hypothetical protein [Microscilla marina]EAY24720.1 hypothetical protein M23134_05522 [Microscilla marina ATCC 23134]